METNPISSTLVHRLLPPARAGAGAPPALILLHGQGAREDTLLRLAPHLDPRFFILSVRAPFPYGRQPGACTWYDIPAPFTPHPEQFAESLCRLRLFVRDVKTGYPVDHRKVFLLGFSMGSVMALALSLTAPGEVRGVVAHSGYVPENTSLEFTWDRLEGLSLFLAHGTADTVVPVEFARRARDLIHKSSAELTYREYPTPHRVGRQSLLDLSGWLGSLLS
ncbi:MAG: alpha/beta fold hydrolase [Acidobacteriota bacterium]|jgi:phospholipase/carboxylesterase|nr:alpha/beta fold hydrolase [Acidobacteriota bacterium]NLT32804.1 alpha/beta fold hydrolase [Acidobacteriota bacterium]